MVKFHVLICDKIKQEKHMKKHIIASILILFNFSLWAGVTQDTISYTINNKSEKKWEGEIVVSQATTSSLLDSTFNEKELSIKPKSSINGTISLQHNTDLSTKDVVFIALENSNRYDEELFWSSIYDISYPGNKHIKSVNCVIEKNSSDYLECTVQTVG